MLHGTNPFPYPVSCAPSGDGQFVAAVLKRAAELSGDLREDQAVRTANAVARMISK